MPVLKIHYYNNQLIHFVTLTIIEWIDIFTKEIYFEKLIESLKFCQQNKGLEIYAYVFMTNHIHIMCRSSGDYSLVNILQSFKRHTTSVCKDLISKDSRKYIKALINTSYYKKDTNRFQLWQDYNYPIPIESEKFLLIKLNYIHNNPVKKQYVLKPEDWVYSSARNYILKDDSIIRVKKWYE